MRLRLSRAFALVIVAGPTACESDLGRGTTSPASSDASSSTAATLTAPVDSSLALFTKGGGCYLPTFAALTGGTSLDLLPLVDPEWAPVVNGGSPLSTPVVMHGKAVDSHVTKDDFPATHVRFDQNTDLALEPGDSGFLATGNLFAGGQPVLELEWETGSYPAWAWAGVGDQVVALGRWIFDCGHPDPIPGLCHGTSLPCVLDADCAAGVSCQGAVVNYRSEMHPPQATAVIRAGRGAVLDEEEDEEAVPVTRADVFVSPDGGGAGDGCVVTHKGSLDAILGAPCFPLSAPLALLPPTAPPLNTTDFTFDLPLPRVAHGREPMVRVVPRPTPSLAGPPVTARLVMTPRLAGSDPHFEVSVRMTEPVDGKPPTGFAATLLAGWEDAPRSRLVHVRVTLEGVVVRSALKAVLPGVPTPPGWKLQANVDGEWQEIAGLEQVADGSEGRFFPVRALYDQFLRRDATLHLHADAASIGCLDTLFAHSLLEDFIRFGFNPADPRTLPGALRLGETCLAATELDPGAVDVTFDGPRFGAREAPYEIASRGGAARTCSTNVSRACTTDADCPAEETCDGAFKLRFRIERGEEERGEKLVPVAALSGRGR